MKEELCGKCVIENKCWFVNKVDAEMSSLPVSSKQTPISSNSTITKEAFNVSNQIARDRIRARFFACPQVNYDPQNPKFQPNL